MLWHPPFRAFSLPGLLLLLTLGNVGFAAEPTTVPPPPADVSPIKLLNADATKLLAEVYQVNETIPLDARLVEKSPKDGILREKIVFRGAQGYLVPAYFQIPPQGNGPFPCVLLLHGWSGSKEHWWIDNNYISGGNVRKALIDRGFAIFALDAQAHGDRIAVNDYAPVNHYNDPDQGPEQRKGYFTREEIYIQTTRDYRRAIKYLSTRPEIDSGRIGLFGYSMGGAQAYLLTGSDPRIKCAVSCCAPREENAYSPVGPQNFLSGLGDRPFLTIMGRKDELCPIGHAQAIHELNPSSRKELIILESGHKFPHDYVPLAVEWIRAHL